MILWGMGSGLGNQLFCLPALKHLAATGRVMIYADGDWPAAELWRRCRYASRIILPSQNLPPYRWAFTGDVAPRAFSRIRYKRCGWPRPSPSIYARPEWCQILSLAGGGTDWIDTTDWCQGVQFNPIYDVGLCVGTKGGEWVRKRYQRWPEVVEACHARGWSVRSFGRREEVLEAGVGAWWTGELPLERLPDALAQCRVVIGVDGGVTHLASSLGLPCVFLFTATSTMKGTPVGPAERNRVLSLDLPCSPCQSSPRWNECQDWRCRKIEVPRIIGQAEELR